MNKHNPIVVRIFGEKLNLDWGKLATRVQFNQPKNEVFRVDYFGTLANPIYVQLNEGIYQLDSDLKATILIEPGKIVTDLIE